MLVDEEASKSLSSPPFKCVAFDLDLDGGIQVRALGLISAEERISAKSITSERSKLAGAAARRSGYEAQCG